jgi:hypothetical protein
VISITAKAWEAIRSLRIDSETVRNARAQQLRLEYEAIRFKEGESVDDFTMCLANLIAALGTVGEVIKEERVIQKLLQVVPKHLSRWPC